MKASRKRGKRHPGVRELRIHKPNPRLVDYCEGLLEKAESGEVKGFVGVVIHADGKVSEAWTHGMKGDLSIISDRIIGCLTRITFQLSADRHKVLLCDDGHGGDPYA